MPDKEFPPKYLTSILIKSSAAGFLLFWLVGVWFLPERALILKYFRGYIGIGFAAMLTGMYVSEQKSKLAKIAGALLTMLGFAFFGAFCALCFYLAVSAVFIK